MSTKITVIPGDGIGPETMTATLRCLEAAGLTGPVIGITVAPTQRDLLLC